MRKIFLFDLETTGTNPELCAVVQIAAAIIIDHQIEDHITLRCRPHQGALIEDKALEITGTTRAGLHLLPHPVEAMNELNAFMGRYIDQYDTEDKAYPLGYNAGFFDVPFLSAFYSRHNYHYLGSFINRRFTLDCLYLLRYLHYRGYFRTLQDTKLSTVYQHLFNRTFDAHDAYNDILATWDVWCALEKMLNPENKFRPVTHRLGDPLPPEPSDPDPTLYRFKGVTKK